MSYLVLARKHRPQTFDTVIGQDHITDLLKKAITSNRVAHAYLFCGPRGVGKTTCARILSLCLNCEGGPSITPDLDSSICREILKGSSLDVIEIDGASNRGIDEIRALRENVKFAPSFGRFKIYIVDEVHMLTTEAFNALLKTLEEPPEHVKFIFATTEPNKVPATIISRTQRYDFKRIPVKTIVSTLEGVVKKEKLKADPEALFAIAKAAQGGMRDALSILDQLSAISERKIESEDVYSMLGLVETQLLFDLADQIALKNCSGSLKLLEEIIDKGKDVKFLVKEIIEHFRNLMVIKVGGKSLGKLVDYPIAVKEQLLIQCEHYSLKEIIVAIDVLVAAQETARITESSRLPLEVAIAKLTYSKENDGKVQPVVKEVKAKAPTPRRPNMVSNNKGSMNIVNESDESEEEIDEAGEPQVVEQMIPQGAQLEIENIVRAWDSLTYAVSRRKMSAATYLQEGKPLEFDGKVLVIGFSHENEFHKEGLESPENSKILEEVFTEKLNTPVILKLVCSDGKKLGASLKEEENVQDALDTFGGKVVSRWHNDDDS